MKPINIQFYFEDLANSSIPIDKRIQMLKSVLCLIGGSTDFNFDGNLNFFRYLFLL